MHTCYTLVVQVQGARGYLVRQPETARIHTGPQRAGQIGQELTKVQRNVSRATQLMQVTQSKKFHARVHCGRDVDRGGWEVEMR